MSVPNLLSALVWVVIATLDLLGQKQIKNIIYTISERQNYLTLNKYCTTTYNSIKHYQKPFNSRCTQVQIQQPIRLHTIPEKSVTFTGNNN